jgi:hypothetical protein
MKTKFMIAILMLGIFGCGGDTQTTPGKGPAFSSALTADGVWYVISRDPYPGFFDSKPVGSHVCDGGGTVLVNQQSSPSLTVTYAYSNCKFGVSLDSDPNLDLVANGNVKIILFPNTDNSASTSQHVSFSGDLGFAADCDYSIKFDSKGITALSCSGSCTYTDSKSKELTIGCDDMMKLLNAGL